MATINRHISGNNHAAEERLRKLAAHFEPDNLRILAKKQFSYTNLNDQHIDALRECIVDADRLVVDSNVLTKLNENGVYQPDDLKLLKNKHQSVDRSHFEHYAVAVVIYAKSTEEVSRVLAYCHKNHIAVTPSGTRTGLEGGSLAIVPGVTLDMSRMSRVLELDEDELIVTIEPGVEKFQLQKYLAKKGYFFPVDPGSNACMGGYANTGASGTLAVKYGTMRENCRSMTVVIADGRVIERTRARTVKSSAGYNIHQLIIGSEGSLVVVTKLVLPIKPLPRAVLATRSQFKDTPSATDFVAKLMKAGLTQLARAELMNESIIEAINIYSKTTFKRMPALFLEFHADTAEEADNCAARARAIADECGALGFESTTNPKELNTMWQARRDAYYAAFKADRTAADAVREQRLAALSADARAQAKPKKLAIFTTDVCVPVPFLSEVIRYTEEAYAAHPSKLPCPVVAHAGDGNFHCMIPYDMNDASESAAVCELNALMIRKAISVGGTISGEHGVGMGKMQFLEEERGPTAMWAMKAVKNALDPHNIMNPYKVFTPLACEDCHAHY